MSNKSLKDLLKLTNIESSYFLHAPKEYWLELGVKQPPYNDIFGEYSFIHAFFDTFNDISNFSDLLVSKLENNGVLWVSYPDGADISDKEVDNLFADHNLQPVGKCIILSNWVAKSYSFKL